MADFSFLRSDLHENSGRNRTYYRGFNDGKPTVSGGRPLAPLTRRTVRDELIDGNREQERLLKKLMEAYNDIGNGINKKSVVNNGSKLRLPGVSTAPVGGRRKLKKRTNGPPRTSSVSVSSKKSSLRNSNTMLNKKSVPQQQSHPTGPQTLASKKETHRFSKPLWAPKRNALLDKQATARAVRRKLNAKPRLTAADKVLMSLSKESNASGGLRVCLNKMGPKGRGLTLFVMLTENTKITCIGADNTRGLKYQLVMKAGDALIDKKIPEKMHVLHAVAVATKFVEIPQQSRKSKRKAIKKLMGDIGGWGDDLEMQINTEIMVSHMNRPKNLNPRQEMQEMNEKSKQVNFYLFPCNCCILIVVYQVFLRQGFLSQVLMLQAAKQRAKMANRAIKTRYLAEVERIRKIDEAISKGKKPTLNPDDDDDFDDDDEETFGDNEEDSNASNFNNQFNQKPKVRENSTLC